MKRAVVIAICIAAVVVFLLLRGHGATSTSASSGSATGSGTTSGSARIARPASQRTGRRIAGVVVGEDSQPIAGAHVQLASRETRAGARAPTIVTSADGAFDFGLKAPLAYVVFANAAKLTGGAYALDLREPQPTDALRLVLHACDTAIHGVVRDTAGGTVAGALVSRASAQTPSTTGAISDANGSYELCVPAGGTSLEVSADGYATVHTRVAVFGRTLRDFMLAPGATVTGKVVRATDKTPVAGATVELREKDGGAQLFATSGQDGAFSIEGVLPGRHVVLAYVDNLTTLDPPEVAVEIGAPNDVTCEISAVASVSGRVVLATDNKVGAAGILVFLGAMTNAGDGWQSVTSTSDGSFFFDRVRPGDYQAALRGSTRDNRPEIHVADADVSGVVLETEAPSSVAGRVVYLGKPVEGAEVKARFASAAETTTTASDGTFSFDGLVADSVQLYAESSRLGAFTNGPTVTLAKGEKKTGVEIALDLSGSIAGVVVDQNNQPVAGAFVRFSLLHGNDFGQATTADDGSFAARAMSGGGEYVYEVTERADSPIVFPPADGKRFAPITVASGSSHVTGLRVKVKRERLTISGHVVDGSGAGVPDATVRARTNGKGGFSLAPIVATTDQSGAFVLRDLSHGSFSLSATATRGESDEASLDAGAINAILTLKQLGNLDVVLDGFTVPVSVVATPRDHAARYSGTRTGNTIHFRNVFPGPYNLEIYGQGDSWDDNSVEVVGGKTTTLTLQPRPLGQVDGTLVDAITKQPIEGAQCAGGSGSWRPVPTDRSGAFHLAAVVTGETPISCWKRGYDVVNREVTVTVNQPVHVDLAMTPSPSDDVKKISSGITFESQLKETMVGAVEPNSPGARAGVQVGDVVTKIDGEDADDSGYLQSVNLQSAGRTMTLELERRDKTLTLTVVFE